MTVTVQDVVGAIGELLRVQPTQEDDGSYRFLYRDFEFEKVEADTLASLVKAVNSFEEVDGTTVITKNSFEVVVQSSKRGIAPWRENIALEDSHAGMSYCLGAPSDAYVVYTCLKLTAVDRRDIRTVRLMMPTSILRDYMARSPEPPKLFDFLRRILRVSTLRIGSEGGAPRQPGSSMLTPSISM